MADARTQVIITTGGTGITSRDGTYEAIDGLLEKRLDGFGELFRMLKPGDWRVRDDEPRDGRHGGAAIFVLPGSPNAVKLAMTKLIIPELGHVAQQLNR